MGINIGSNGVKNIKPAGTNGMPSSVNNIMNNSGGTGHGNIHIDVEPLAENLDLSKIAPTAGDALSGNYIDETKIYKESFKNVNFEQRSDGTYVVKGANDEKIGFVTIDSFNNMNQPSTAGANENISSGVAGQVDYEQKEIIPKGDYEPGSQTIENTGAVNYENDSNSYVATPREPLINDNYEPGLTGRVDYEQKEIIPKGDYEPGSQTIENTGEIKYENDSVLETPPSEPLINNEAELQKTEEIDYEKQETVQSLEDESERPAIDYANTPAYVNEYRKNVAPAEHVFINPDTGLFDVGGVLPLPFIGAEDVSRLVVTSGMGDGRSIPHHGWDIVMETSSNGRNVSIAAQAYGTVIERRETKSGGKQIKVEYTLANGKKLYAVYSHLKEFGNYKTGDTLKPADVLGTQGATGAGSAVQAVTGVHLDIKYYDNPNEKNPIDPKEIMLNEEKNITVFKNYTGFNPKSSQDYVFDIDNISKPTSIDNSKINYSNDNGEERPSIDISSDPRYAPTDLSSNNLNAASNKIGVDSDISAMSTSPAVFNNEYTGNVVSKPSANEHTIETNGVITTDNQKYVVVPDSEYNNSAGTISESDYNLLIAQVAGEGGNVNPADDMLAVTTTVFNRLETNPNLNSVREVLEDGYFPWGKSFENYIQGGSAYNTEAGQEKLEIAKKCVDDALNGIRNLDIDTQFYAGHDNGDGTRSNRFSQTDK